GAAGRLGGGGGMVRGAGGTLSPDTDSAEGRGAAGRPAWVPGTAKAGGTAPGGTERARARGGPGVEGGRGRPGGRAVRGGGGGGGRWRGAGVAWPGAGRAAAEGLGSEDAGAPGGVR